MSAPGRSEALIPKRAARRVVNERARPFRGTLFPSAESRYNAWVPRRRYLDEAATGTFASRPPQPRPRRHP